jgi:uncharacterized cupin superfamily protein
MYIPPGGGPPPHRHDFEEMFSILEGEIEFVFRGSKSVLRAGETANVPANAPHQFQNKTGQPARMLCLCAPAGQELFFLEMGVPVSNRTSAPPRFDDAALAALKAKSQLLAPKYKTEFIKQSG